MEVVSHVIGFGDSVVAIVDAEERDLSLSDVGFGEVGNDTDSVLVMGEYGSRMTVG